MDSSPKRVRSGAKSLKGLISKFVLSTFGATIAVAVAVAVAAEAVVADMMDFALGGD